MIGINLLAVMLTQVDKLLLSKLIPLEQFGYYVLATSVCALMYTLTAPVTQALSPSIVQATTLEDGAWLARLYHGGAQLITVAVAPVAFLLVAFGHDALFVWTGDSTLAGHVAPLLALLAVGTLLNGMMQLPYFTMIAHGWTRLSLLSNVVAVAVLVPLLLVVVPAYGGRGAALVWIVLNSGYLLVQAPLMHRRILPGELARWYGADLGLPMLAAGLECWRHCFCAGNSTSRDGNWRWCWWRHGGRRWCRRQWRRDRCGEECTSFCGIDWQSRRGPLSDRRWAEPKTELLLEMLCP